MTGAEHESFAKDLLSSLSDDRSEVEAIDFTPDRTQSRNAANAMTAILCHRLFKKSNHQPMRIGNKIFEWKEGVFNNRNIADRASLWTNMRCHVAATMHGYSKTK